MVDMMLAVTIGEAWHLRISGPGSFRFILQPIAAILLGIRDGIRDAKLGEPPYIYHVLFDAQQRKASLINGFKATMIPITIGTILDGIFQYYVLHQLRLIPALLVGGLLIGLPYTISRGLTNRLVQRRIQHKETRDDSEKA